MMMQQLWKIGSSCKMEKLMLTVLKGRWWRYDAEQGILTHWIRKHNSCWVLQTIRVRVREEKGHELIGYSFVVDETSPSKFQEEVDYEIMSSSLYIDVCWQSFMLSLRALRVATPRLSSRRYASSHGEPHYNEPSGWLFGEKVRTCANQHHKTILILATSRFHPVRNE